MSALPTNMTRRRFCAVDCCRRCERRMRRRAFRMRRQRRRWKLFCERRGVKNQVIVAMNMNSEPAAGFRPLCVGVAANTCMSPRSNPPLITTDANLEFVKSCHGVLLRRRWNDLVFHYS